MTTLLTELEALATDWDDGYATWRRAAASLRTLIAAEKARGPDPLLEQAREALGRYDKILATIHYTHPHLGWSDEDGEFIRTVFAALDARLGVKP
jgi:hypothetical protein